MTLLRKSVSLLLFGVLVLTSSRPDLHRVDAAPPINPDVLLEGNVVTMNADRDIIHNASVLVRDGRIAAIWRGGKPPDGVSLAGVVRAPLGPHAIIYPGLINLHDHPFFDMLPLWRAPSSHQQPQVGRPLGTEPYANRYQWNSAPLTQEFMRLVQNPATMMTSGAGLARLNESIKFAKARMILGGTTTTQGGGTSDTDPVLARNVDAFNFGRLKVFSRVGSINAISAGEQSQVQQGMAAGFVDAWLVHLAEGVRDGDRRAGDPFSSRAEFATLKSKHLLTDATVIVHGAGLEPEDFVEMANAPAARADGIGDGRGAKLVWSPLSNLLLYGRTAAVYDAVAAGVTVSLGTDWSPSGSPNLLTELKIADRALRDDAILGSRRHIVPGLSVGNDQDRGTAERALDQLLVEMVTINPAQAVRWDDQVGSIEVGKVADLLVIDGDSEGSHGAPESPYRRLIDATEKDVALVMVGGAAVAGDVDVMAEIKGDDFEIVSSETSCFDKAIDVTVPAVPNGSQTFGQITSLLRDGLGALGGDHPPAGGGPSSPFANTWSYLKARIPGASGLPDLFFNFALIQFFGATPDGKVNLESIALPPVFVADDHWWFATLAGAGDPQPPYAAYASNSNYAFSGNDLRERYDAAQCPVH